MSIPIQIFEIKQQQNRLSVHILPNQERERELLKQNILGRKWDPNSKYWTIPYTRATLVQLTSIFDNQYQLNFKIRNDIPDSFTPVQRSKPSKGYNLERLKKQLKYPQAIDALEQDLILKRYSYSTIKSYKHHLANFIWYYNEQKPSSLSIKEVKQYILHKIKTEKIAERTQNQMINALKYFYEKILNREKMFIDLGRPKIPKDKPDYLSPDEIKRLLDATTNLKHKTILMTIYSGGLRLSDVVNLRIQDIRSSENYIRVCSGKGKKDRTTLLSPKLLSLLRTYYKQYRPHYYLFEGQHGGQYNKRSVQHIMANAVKKSRVHHATVHTLRHSFATHLVQAGTAIAHVKELLGHGSIKTTEIYLHLSQNDLRKISSPLDKLYI